MIVKRNGRSGKGGVAIILSWREAKHLLRVVHFDAQVPNLAAKEEQWGMTSDDVRELTRVMEGLYAGLTKLQISKKEGE